MKPALIVTHMPDRAVGIVRDCLESAGCEVIERNPDDHVPMPSADDVSGIVSLGGRQSARHVDADPFIAAEVALLVGALERQVPALGMCLGAQLLAVAGGGEVTYSGRMSAGWPEMSMLPAAADDPVYASFPPSLPVLKWHEDLIAPPPGALELATTPGPGSALFRIGPCAWGSQAHLELTPSMLIDGWLSDASDIAEVEATGNPIDAFRSDSRSHLEVQMAAARPMFSAFGRLTISLTSSTA